MVQIRVGGVGEVCTGSASSRGRLARRRKARTPALAVALLILGSACGQLEEPNATSDHVQSTAAAEGPCGWDPEFGLSSCVQSDWWIEYSTRDTTTTAVEVEVTGTPNRIVRLPNRLRLGNGQWKFTGGPSSPVRAGTLIRIKATQGSTGRTAMSVWFAYRQVTPTLACQSCTPVCAPGSCGSDGCGGTCGPCAAGTTCSAGQCVCTPSCGSNVCGSNGCGGTCGTCGGGTTCQSGQCVATGGGAGGGSGGGTGGGSGGGTGGGSGGGTGGGSGGGTGGGSGGGTGGGSGGGTGGGSGGCVASWDPTWRHGDDPGDWWTEFRVAGGGVLTTAVWVEVVGSSTTRPLTWGWGRWAGSVNNLTAGTWIILHARDALGATSQTVPFRYRVDLAPATDACRTTPRTNTNCQPLARGMVTITIDDSGSSQPTIAAPLLNQHGVKATFFHVPNFLSWPAEARTLAQQGHETGSHTMTHRSLTALSTQEMADELRQSRQWLEANISSPVESFATPSGAYNAAVVAAVKPFYASHRTTVEDMNYVGTDVYELNTYFGLNTSSASAFCAQMREAAALKSWLIYTFHDFTTGSANQGFTVTSSFFNAILACAKNTPGLDVVTQRQGVAAIRCGSPGAGGGTGGGTGGGSGGGAGGGSGGGAGGGSGGGAGGGTGGGASGGGTGGGTSTGGFTLGPTGCTPETIDANVNLGGFISDRYNWSDSNCARRSASLVRNNTADPGGSSGGYLRELTFTVNGATRTARGTGTNNYNGWGYVVNHYGSGAADTSKGHTGTFRTVLGGQHHAIHEFRVQMSPGGPVMATVHWFFATGRSEPVYAITYDVNAPANTVYADTRAPYGDMAFEGQAGPIGGIGWGDTHRFTTLGNGPVTWNTAWDYTQPNTVPYVRMWSSAVDAEMGAVQTQTMDQRVAGGEYGSDIFDCQGHTSSNKGSNCSEGGQTMPANWLWPFQLNQYELDATSSSHRLAWGSNYGAIGRTSTTAFGRTFSGYPQMKYAVFLVLGARTNNATFTRVTQVERLTSTVVTGATWNQMYAAWEAPAVAGGTTLSVDPRGGAITAPIFRFTNFTASQLSEVTVGGVALQAGVGYFATIDAATQSVWITLNGTVSSPISLRVR